MQLTNRLKQRYSYYMEVKCAWCGRIIKSSDTPLTSHGICRECKKAFQLSRKSEKNISDVIHLSQQDAPSHKDCFENDGKQKDF